MSDLQNKEVQDKEEEKKLPLTWERLVKMGFHVWRQFDDQYYAGFAGMLAYFFLMSAVPMLIVLTQVLGIFDISMDFVREWLTTHLSTHMSSFMESLFSASSTGISNFIMIILVLWASSSLSFSLSRLTTYTLTNGKYRYSYFTERLKAIPMALILILAVATILVVYVYGELIAQSVLRNPKIYAVISELRTPLLAVMFFLFMLLIYYVLPRVRVPIKAVLPGAVLATIGLMLVTWLYSLYIDRATNYNLLYGAFSNIVAMMLWFYLISWVLCIGMMFNKSWDIQLRRGRLSPEKIKEYVLKQYGDRGEEMWNKLFYGEYDMADRRLDSIAVRASRKFDPGYQAKREREIDELVAERTLRQKVEKKIVAEAEAEAEMEDNTDGRQERTSADNES